jgi:hypothetical protein
MGSLPWRGDEVRSQAYVEDQCRSICEQAAAASQFLTLAPEAATS